jgi:hypothetical protein
MAFRTCIYFESGKCAQMNGAKCDMTAKTEKKCPAFDKGKVKE